MPRRSVEARLQSLQDKRAALAKEIKKMEAEKAQELRQRQRQREALLGKVIYQLIADGAVINADTWTSEFIHQLMDAQLTRQRDRQLFGLQTLTTVQTAVADGHTGHQTQQQEPSDRAANATGNSVAAAMTDNDTAIDQQRAKAPQRSLKVNSSQEDLIDEFNL